MKPKDPWTVKGRDAERLVRNMKRNEQKPEVRKGGKQQKTVSPDEVASPVGATAPEIKAAVEKVYLKWFSSGKSVAELGIEKGIKLGIQQGIKLGQSEIQKLKDEVQFKDNRVSELMVERDFGKWKAMERQKGRDEVLELIDEEIEYLDNHVSKANEGIKVNVVAIKNWIFEAKRLSQAIKSKFAKGGKA